MCAVIDPKTRLASSDEPVADGEMSGPIALRDALETLVHTAIAEYVAVEAGKVPEFYVAALSFEEVIDKLAIASADRRLKHLVEVLNEHLRRYNDLVEGSSRDEAERDERRRKREHRVKDALNEAIFRQGAYQADLSRYWDMVSIAKGQGVPEHAITATERYLKPNRWRSQIYQGMRDYLMDRDDEESREQQPTQQALDEAFAAVLTDLYRQADASVRARLGVSRPAGSVL